MSILLNGTQANAVTKATAKKQISLSTTLVVKAESSTKSASFAVNTAQAALITAQAQVKKVNSYGKLYSTSYLSLTKRLGVVKGKINKRVAILALEKKSINDIKSAQMAVSNLEKLTNTDIYNLVDNELNLTNAQKAITSAKATTSKLVQTSSDSKVF